MKKRMLDFAMIAILALIMNTLTGCGNDEYIDTMTIDEIVDYAESYGIEVTVTPVVYEDEAVVEDEVIVEDETAAEDEVVEDEPAAVQTASPKTDPVNTAKPAPVATPEPVQPAPTPEPTPTATPEPAHTHTWKEHTATTQTWVPNIVTVDDYEEQVTEYGEFNCSNCDFTTNDRDAIADHVYATMHGFAILTHKKVEQVKVGSHEEDHGYYETSTYVDYYYCDCGERK